MISKEQQDLQRQALDTDTLLAEARQQAGLTDFGDESFMIPLRKLMECTAQDVNFHEAGLKDLREFTVRDLVNRLRIEQDLKRHPEILEEDVSQPIILLGVTRSGTTKTHRSIGSDPHLLKTYMWQLTNPARFPDAVPGEPDPRIAAAMASDPLLKDNAAIRAAHLYGVNEIQSDIFLFGLTFNSEFYIQGRMYSPSFVEWIQSRTFPPNVDNYRYLRQVYQYLQWQQGGRQGRRWLMKHESGIGDIDAICEVFPDATLVHLHRDPREFVPSTASLSNNIMALRMAEVDPQVNARHQMDRLKRLTDRYLVMREQLGLDGRIVDVAYEDARKKPIEVAEKVYRRAGFPLTEEGRAAMLKWEADNKQGKHGEHRYSLEDFGMSTAMVEDAFADYMRKFADFI